MAGAGLFWEKSTAGWLLVADLFWEKSTVGWWLISQANRLFEPFYCRQVQQHADNKQDLRVHADRTAMIKCHRASCIYYWPGSNQCERLLSLKQATTTSNSKEYYFEAYSHRFKLCRTIFLYIYIFMCYAPRHTLYI
jgi:hypothetical protein